MRTLRIALMLGLVGFLVTPAEAVDGPCKLATKGDSSVVDDGRYDVLKEDGRKRLDQLTASLARK
jgi:hypothetical protein